MQFVSALKIILHFGCTNIIFADCEFVNELWTFQRFYILNSTRLHLFLKIDFVKIICNVYSKSK